MKILRDHFDGKPTIFVNDRIINGCQDFTIDQLDSICGKYKVSSEMKQDVLDNYTGALSTEEDILSFIKDTNVIVRMAVANQGFGLDTLINDESWEVRMAVANQGFGLDVLVNDKGGYVRKAVANQGFGLDILINDEVWMVRRAARNYTK